MPLADAQIDANFFQMVHQFARSAPDDTGDRRRQGRHSYPSLQWIAPWDGFRFPAESEFIEVECHDLTRGGFSFLHPRRPELQLLVGGFGRKPDLLFVGAEVVRCTPVLLFPSGRLKCLREEEASDHPLESDGETGRRRILVGCRFTRRLHGWPGMDKGR